LNEILKRVVDVMREVSNEILAYNVAGVAITVLRGKVIIDFEKLVRAMQMFSVNVNAERLVNRVKQYLSEHGYMQFDYVAVKHTNNEIEEAKEVLEGIAKIVVSFMKRD